MANNRMWLVHKASGRAVLLAKFYPSIGWFHPAAPDMGEKVNSFLTETETSPTEETEWELRYESEPDFEYVAGGDEPVVVSPRKI